MLRQQNAYKTPDFTNCDPSELFTCPYDANHKIRAKRFPYHIKNCRKNHPLSNMVNCPFNARHVVPGPEYKYHLTTCPDKRVIEQDIAYAYQKQNGEESAFKGCTDVPAYNTWQPPPCSEDWDEEIANERNYDYNPPTEVAQQIYRSTCGMTPAEKRARREYLNKQFERQQAGLPPEPEHIGEESDMPTLIPPSGQAPLRLPRGPAKAYQHVNQNQMSIGGENSRLGLIGLGRGLLMNKQIMMVNELGKQVEANDDDDVTNTQRATLPTTQGFGRGMAANFGTAHNETNGYASASSAQTYVRMVGRGRGGTPQNRNRQPVGGLSAQPVGGLPDQPVGGLSGQPVGGLAEQKTQTSNAINNPQSPKKQEEENQFLGVTEKETTQASSADSSSSQEEAEDAIRKKLIRKLTKKLQGIKILAKNKEEGKNLTEEEELKVQKKDLIEKEIAVLGQLG